MAYFSKEIYALKREYAGRVSNDSIDILSAATKYEHDDLECVSNLSHARHEIHSCNRSYLYCGEGAFDTIRSVGTQYTIDNALIDIVNALNLIETELPLINEPEVNDDDSTEDIFDYYGEECPEITDDNEFDVRRDALNLIADDWDLEINRWSDNVRKWFKELNEKYGTAFPS